MKNLHTAARHSRHGIVGLLLLGACAMVGARAQQPAKASLQPVPLSSFASPQAHALYAELTRRERNNPPGPGILEKRKYYDDWNAQRVVRMRALYPVDTRSQTIAGVTVDVVEPKQGVSVGNRDKVLINLHGGAFAWGARSGALVEAIPIASTGGFKVIAVDYRMAPEHRFPAASEDVAKVYRALLKDYRPENIGLYGCSAGAYLVGQSIAWFAEHALPMPGAVGMFCGGVVAPGGDSLSAAAYLNGTPASSPGDTAKLPYLEGADLSSPLVIPANSPRLLASFPSTLLISGTRDFNLSSVIQSDNLLKAAGVTSELRLWDGMWHAFFVDPEMPESGQAYRAIAGFFAGHLGKHRSSDVARKQAPP